MFIGSKRRGLKMLKRTTCQSLRNRTWNGDCQESGGFERADTYLGIGSLCYKDILFFLCIAFTF